MFLKPQKLGNDGLSEEELLADRKNCKKIGPCGVGKKALYLNSFYIDRQYYIPVRSVSRVFKRVAMSKGGFSGKGMFATIPYLVVVYEDGKEKQCNFKYEDQVDIFLSWIRQDFPQIKTVSHVAEVRMAEEEKLKRQKKTVPLSEKAGETVEQLLEAKEYLEQKPVLFTELSNAARKKRTYEQTKPYYKWGALFFVLLGIAALIYGVISLRTQAPFAVWFVLFGIAAIFLFSGANVMPTSRNNREAIESRLAAAEEAVERFREVCPDASFAVGECMNGDPFELALALVRYGFRVPEIYGTITAENFVYIRHLAELSPDTKVFSNMEPTMLYYDPSGSGVNLTIGKDAGYYHRDQPNAVWNQDRQPYGYAGVRRLFEILTEKVLQKGEKV